MYACACARYAAIEIEQQTLDSGNKNNRQQIKFMPCCSYSYRFLPFAFFLLVSRLLFCCSIFVCPFFIHFCTFAVCCSPKQMLPATERERNRPQLQSETHSGYPLRLFCACFFSGSLAAGVQEGGWWGRARRVERAVTLRKYVTAFVTHFRVNFLLHPT